MKRSQRGTGQLPLTMAGVQSLLGDVLRNQDDHTRRIDLLIGRVGELADNDFRLARAQQLQADMLSKHTELLEKLVRGQDEILRRLPPPSEDGSARPSEAR